MVAKVIRDYFVVEGRNKLTVPGFGTFMRRDTGDVVFVDLLRTDDGVLAELVEDTGNYSEVEAMALIDRFIFNVRKDVERSGRAVLEGFGEMSRNENDSFQFKYAPARKLVPETGVAQKLFDNNNAREPERPASHQQTRPASPVRPVQRRPAQPHKQPSKRADIIIIVAVIAAAIAVIALAFGLSTGNMPF